LINPKISQNNVVSKTGVGIELRDTIYGTGGLFQATFNGKVSK
jgi:hypothetical protein